MYTVLLHLHIKRVTADIEYPSRPGFVIAAFHQSFSDNFDLLILQGISRCIRGSGGCVRGNHIGGEIVGLDLRPRPDRSGVIKNILEFSNVPRPAVITEESGNSRRDFLAALIVFPAELIEKERCEKFNITFSFAKRRDI